MSNYIPEPVKQREAQIVAHLTGIRPLSDCLVLCTQFIGSSFQTSSYRAFPAYHPSRHPPFHLSRLPIKRLRRPPVLGPHVIRHGLGLLVVVVRVAVVVVRVRVVGRADVLHSVDAAALGAALDRAGAGHLFFWVSWGRGWLKR